ncbi:sugar ABC transporter ATP-binding protein [Streptomyces coeruleorubidus]|uniref:sugar ABC transporter ATP-binding protein n=1 Tax=Streptomyces coeruleorubidus TaxID=116188 RepID=UPI00237F7034|nr:sugar ABC transporter ATP-binding protein [Streptomyces coeruleorubidus]WDV56267.1 sugar ABC transporter ATP-binding protein [Streptomyces coeruleorubidus]
MTTTNLRISGLAKSFGGVRALDGVDLTVPAGQVHALLGHNGAGKSTLIKCLGGAYPPDAGTIEVGGASYSRLTPRESIAAGVAIIFQTLSVVDALTVAENIFLGQEWTRYGRIDRRAQEEVAAGLLQRVAARCSPRDRVGDLPMGQRQLVEIAKALSRSASVLVLDEPTAALSGAETGALAERVEDLRAQGLAIVYVTHLLSEVERLADAVTVLRDGRVTHQATVAGQTRRDLVEAIAGRPTEAVHGPGRATDAEAPEARRGTSPDTGRPQHAPGPGGHDARRMSSPDSQDPRRTPGRDERDPAATPGPDTPEPQRTPPPPRLVVEALRGPGFGPVGLTVAEGERVGLFGLIGSGRTRILETLYGRRRATAGTIRVGERTVSPACPADALGAGIALVPADRRAQGVFPSLSAQDNTLLPAVRTLARYNVRALRTERRVFDALATAVGLRPARPGLPAGAFSGGNQQKLVLGRWINEARHVDVLLLDEPTQGVDVGARQEIYRVVSGLAAERGTAVLFASSDPEEIVALADRCLIVARGRIVGELSGAGLTEQALLSAVHDADPDPLPAEGAA